MHPNAREWFNEIETVLQDLGFEKFSWTNCIYVYQKNVILLLYVDNIILCGHNETLISKIINKLNEKFDLKILGKTKKLLGVHFEEVNGNLSIKQTEYIEKIWKKLKKFEPR